jgi:hypothetical protein
MADGQALEQRADRAVRAVALVGAVPAVAGALPTERGEDLGEIGRDVLAERADPPRIEPGDVLVERVDEHAGRQVALELRRASVEHEEALRVRVRDQLAEEPVLPMPGSPASSSAALSPPPRRPAARRPRSARRRARRDAR